MNNLITRTLYGLLFALIVLGSILYSPYLFGFLMFIFSILGISEMTKLYKKSKFKWNDKLLFSLNGLVVYVVLAGIALDFFKLNSLVFVLAAFLFPFIHGLFSHKKLFPEIAVVHWASLLFVAVPSSLLLFFFDDKVAGEMAGSYLVITVILGIWINDIFAYLVGSQFGKHKLFPRISPKKSWEGSFGGLIFTLIAAYLLSYFSDWITLQHALIIAVIVVVFGSLGDLIESMLKRQANVKDSGKILPGHGGVLDRFDATFFAVPFVFIYLIMIL